MDDGHHARARIGRSVATDGDHDFNTSGAREFEGRGEVRTREVIVVAGDRRERIAGAEDGETRIPRGSCAGRDSPDVAHGWREAVVADVVEEVVAVDARIANAGEVKVARACNGRKVIWSDEQFNVRRRVADATTTAAGTGRCDAEVANAAASSREATNHDGHGLTLDERGRGRRLQCAGVVVARKHAVGWVAVVHHGDARVETGTRARGERVGVGRSRGEREVHRLVDRVIRSAASDGLRGRRIRAVERVRAFGGHERFSAVAARWWWRREADREAARGGERRRSVATDDDVVRHARLEIRSQRDARIAGVQAACPESGAARVGAGVVVVRDDAEEACAASRAHGTDRHLGVDVRAAHAKGVRARRARREREPASLVDGGRAARERRLGELVAKGRVAGVGVVAHNNRDRRAAGALRHRRRRDNGRSRCATDECPIRRTHLKNLLTRVFTVSYTRSAEFIAR